MPYLSAINGYTVPPMDQKESQKLGWFKEQAESAETFLKSQRCWPDIDASIEILMGTLNTKIPLKQSKVFANVLKRDVRETVATLANMRPLWGFKTDNDEYQHQQTVLNKMLMAWYMRPKSYSSIRKVLQHAGGSGTGYMSPTWKKETIISGKGDIALDDYGARDVLPFGIGKDNDLQRAYVVTIRIETPAHEAMAMFPTMIDKLIPDRGAPTWMKRGVRRVQRFLSPVLNQFGPGAERDQDESPFPTVDIFHSYILDLSVNMTGRELTMGTPGTSWEYKVPDYKQKIETGTYDKAGNPLFREATYEDARMFPLRRLCKWTKQGILYDDTSPWWHGMVPLARIQLDDWPWDYLGFPQPRDGASLQEAATSLTRGVVDAAQTRLDPPIGYDENQMSRGLMERFKPRSPGQRIPINMQMSDAMKVLIPAENYDVGAWIPGVIDKLYEQMHYLLGTRDIQAIAKARQVPSGDSLEKLMELSGPILTDMSRGMEGAMVEVGEMWKGLAFQFYSLKRRVQVLGKDGVAEEDFDFDPGNMIPSHLPDEIEKIKERRKLWAVNTDPNKAPFKEETSRSSIVERARAHLNSFYFHITPNSMHQITQLTKKLLMMQLWKGGFPIDPWTLAEAMDLQNFGSPALLSKILGTPSSDIPTDIMGRWIMWKELMTKMAPQQGQPGRKSSGQVPPTIQSKDGGQRTTVRESQR